MSRKRITQADLDWWKEHNPTHYKVMQARFARQQETSRTQREALIAAVPEWYDHPLTAYAIKDKAWGKYPGRGYGAGAAEKMLDRLVKDGMVEATQAQGYREGVMGYRLVNDGQTPKPPPPPPRPKESRPIFAKESDVIDHLRYGLTTDDLGEMRWHLEQIAAALKVKLDFEYEPGTPPS